MTKFTGTNNDETFTGTSGDDQAYGLAGLDNLAGLGGNDALDGGDGSDTLDGGDDHDVLVGGAGADTILGGAGDDRLYSALFAPFPALDAGSEADSLSGGAGSDMLFAGFEDVVDGGEGFDTLNISFRGAGAGVHADFSALSFGATVVVGNGFVKNVESIAFLEGSEFSDYLNLRSVGGAGPVYGLGGHDQIFAGPYTSLVDGGDGDDFIDLTGAFYRPTALGGAGNDQIDGGASDERIEGGAGIDTLRGGAGSDLLLGGDDNDTIDGGSFADDIQGGAGNDTLYGAGDADRIDGGDGQDIIHGDDSQISLANATGSNDDVIFGGAGSDSLYGELGDDAIDGGADSDHLHGGDGHDTLIGGAGNDLILGGIGLDIAHGGADLDQIQNCEQAFGEGGDDRIYFGAEFGDSCIVDGGDGADILYLRGDYGPLALEDLPIASIESIVLLSGQDGSFETPVPGAAHDYDVTVGDSYLAAGATLQVVAASLKAGETFRFDGSAETDGRFALVGGQADDLLIGGRLNDTLDGGAGADTLRGGLGDDSYLVFDAGDVIQEEPGGGVDEAYTLLASYSLAGTGVEKIFGIFNVAQTLTGNGLDNLIDGGNGADTAIGGLGDDIYIVGDAGDRVVEAAGEGSDRVKARGHFTLEAGSHVEMLTTIDNLAASAIDLTGNAFAQFLYGNAGANRLDGGGGGDVLVGFGGNDNYFIRSAADRVIEAAGEGSDRVFAFTSFTLGAGSHVEMLTTNDNLAVTAINLTGNALTQYLYGNAGANTLDGGGGGDVMVGLAGDDRYFVRHSGDRAVEAAAGGSDRVFAGVSFALETGSHVEVMSTIDNLGSAAIDLVGNELAQFLYGNAGANRLDGKGGADVLTGFGGADTFAFTTGLGGGNVDRITDLQAGTDRIALDDAVFTGLGLGTLSANAFVTGSAAQDADDRIIYNSATGALFFDADGSGAGAAVQFATVAVGLNLTASDFSVI